MEEMKLSIGTPGWSGQRPSQRKSVPMDNFNPGVLSR